MKIVVNVRPFSAPVESVTWEVTHVNCWSCDGVCQQVIKPSGDLTLPFVPPSEPLVLVTEPAAMPQHVREESQVSTTTSSSTSFKQSMVVETSSFSRVVTSDGVTDEKKHSTSSAAASQVHMADGQPTVEVMTQMCKVLAVLRRYSLASHFSLSPSVPRVL